MNAQDILIAAKEEAARERDAIRKETADDIRAGKAAEHRLRTAERRVDDLNRAIGDLKNAQEKRGRPA